MQDPFASSGGAVTAAQSGGRGSGSVFVRGATADFDDFQGWHPEDDPDDDGHAGYQPPTDNYTLEPKQQARPTPTREPQSDSDDDPFGWLGGSGGN